MFDTIKSLALLLWCSLLFPFKFMVACICLHYSSVHLLFPLTNLTSSCIYTIFSNPVVLHSTSSPPTYVKSSLVKLQFSFLYSKSPAFTCLTLLHFCTYPSALCRTPLLMRYHLSFALGISSALALKLFLAFCPRSGNDCGTSSLLIAGSLAQMADTLLLCSYSSQKCLST